MCLIGITGTLGKTSTALLIQAALDASGVPVGVIGSLGVRIHGRVADTGMTTPDAPAIHRALRRMLDAACLPRSSRSLPTASRCAGSPGFRSRSASSPTWCPTSISTFTGPPSTTSDQGSLPRHADRRGPASSSTRTTSGSRAMVEESLARRSRPVVRVTCGDDPAASDGGRGAAHRRDRLRLRAGDPAHRCRDSTAGCSSPCDVPLVLPVFGVHQVANAALGGHGRARRRGVPGGSHRGRRRDGSDPAANGDRPGRGPGRSRRHRRQSPDSRGGVRQHRRHPPPAGCASCSASAVRVVPTSTGASPRRSPSWCGPAPARRAGDARRHLERRLGRTTRIGCVGGGAGGRARRASCEAAWTTRYEPELAPAVRRALDGWAEDDLVLLLGAQGMDGAAEQARAVLDGNARLRDADRACPPPRRRRR